VETKTKVEENAFINASENLALAGSVNFEDEESLTIYSAILKNVIGDKAGAYVGNQMDKLAASLQNEFNYSELLRAGEGLILEFNTESDLYFDTGKTSLNPSSREVLDKIITILGQHPKSNIIIETHTDNSGDDAVNLKMTSERLSSIQNYLLENGIKESRLKSKAFGESQPKFKNDTSQNRAKNRRVEFGFYASDALKEEARNMTD
jgi:outer membrane protein OmpA-like peptidoglycan-associated protein